MTYLDLSAFGGLILGEGKSKRRSLLVRLQVEEDEAEVEEDQDNCAWSCAVCKVARTSGGRRPPARTDR